MSQQQIESIVSDLGGKENIKDYFHCATRLRFNLYDYEKINKDALNSNPLLLSVVQASGQCQLIIGNKVGAVYSALHDMLEKGGQDTAQEAPETTSTKESVTSRIFAFVSGSFLPLIGILAAAGLLRAFTTLSLSLPSLAGNSTLTLLSFIANVPFYFMPVLLGFTIARKLKSNELIGAIIGASLLYPEFNQLAGQTLNIIGLPMIIMDYGYSIFPIFFAVPVAAVLERFLKTRLYDSIQLFMVPLLCVVIVVPITMFLLGPFGKYLGDYLATAIVYIISVNSLVAGMIIGAAYSFIVLFGLHWAIIPVVFSNIAHGGDPIYAIGGMSAIAQMGVALGILIRTRDSKTRQLASSAFFPSLISGVTEPILYGLIIPNRRTIYYIIVAGAVGGGIIGGSNITINNLVFASLLSIPTASNMAVYSTALFATLITGASLPVILGYKSRG
ncbi:PTS transporter subunit EIIC [Salmonella enterica]|nr:PTS EIIC subunit [Salmonella enterica subsp. salamae]ECL1288132.1 PTS EIIC subunit [Salmonella enterica]ECJ2729146.1 PTS EIIC subunit [Salmonella enterica subsp. salamae]EEA0957366.1 PTS EIIC subunit [Salmonella enterica]EGH5308846.1 PTS transporter subunit EIIC [Salmonella enterica]